MPTDTEHQLLLLRLLIARLERLSADSLWARRASGCRGALLKLQEEIESGQPYDADRLQFLLDWGFEMLHRAARELIE
jgi:hypothetical protein